MKNYVKEGDRTTYTNSTGTDIKSGDPVVIGSTIGVACVDIANGASGAVALEGVYTLPKTAGSSGHAIAQGDIMLFDISAGEFDIKTATDAAGDILGGCIADSAALTTDTTVNVRLCGPGAIQTGA
ncbi:DUF2190 family protein [Trichlorobacter lovleyi]|uniref:DUF2190 family protein n=1 Tax=Trichlorobacter lovleyi TaxID=313985 RepID=UPI003D117EA1